MPWPRRLHEDCQSGRSSSTVSSYGKTRIATTGSRDPILKLDCETAKHEAWEDRSHLSELAKA
jgi:hypothetical protein